MQLEWRYDKHTTYTYYNVTDIEILATCIQFTCDTPHGRKRLTNALDKPHYLVDEDGTKTPVR